MIKNNPCLFSYPNKGIRFSWEITNQCNFGCKHCCVNADSFKKENLDLKRALFLIDEMRKKRVKSIYFTGGEPFLYKNFLNILEKTTRNKIKINLATNGSLISKEVAFRLARYQINSVLISLDGYNKEINNEFRNNPLAFQKAIQAIKNLREVGIKVKIGTVIWKKNIDYLEEIIKLAISIKANQIYFSWPIVVGRLILNKKILPPENKFLQCIKLLKKLKIKYKGKIMITYKRFISFGVEVDNCPGAKKLFHIDSKGYVYPCSWMAKIKPEFRSDKSLKKISLSQTLQSKKLQDFRKIVIDRAKKFGPGCPAMCFIKNKTFNCFDPLYKK